MINVFAFYSIGYIFALMFFFVAIAKVAMPYSARALKWLNILSYKNYFTKGLSVLFVILYFLIMSSSVFFGFSDISSVAILDILKALAFALLLGVIAAGVTLAVIRYSYDYIVNNKKEE